MSKGPSSEHRPANVVGVAVMIAKIARSEIEDNKKSGRVRSGEAAAKARSNKLSKERRSEIAKIAAEARWDKK